MACRISILKCIKTCNYQVCSNLLRISSSLFCHSNKPDVLLHASRYFHSNILSNIDDKSFSDYLEYIRTLIPDDFERRRLKVHLPKLLSEELGGSSPDFIPKLASVKEYLDEVLIKETELKELMTLADECKNDADLNHQVEGDKTNLLDAIVDLKNSIANTIVKDREVEKCDGVIMEIVPGIGGAESMLFASDLLGMYQLLCERLGLEVQIIDLQETAIGGILSASAFIPSSDGFAYKLLRYESGTHRVQRVPKTETQGRMHTSTVNVVIMAKQTDNQDAIDKKDLDITYSLCGGKGGQAVQTSHSAVRVNHRPTGISIRCEATRNQVDNLNRAMLQLTHILHKRKVDATKAKELSLRGSIIRNRERSDKIRTYNFPQDRVTDHRIGHTINNVGAILNGGPQLESMMQVLDEKYTMETRVAVLNALIRESLNSK